VSNAHRTFGILSPRTVAEEFVSIDMGSTDIVNGLRRPSPEPSDGETIPGTVTNQCLSKLVLLRMNRGLDGTTGSSDRYIYLRVDDQFIFQDSHPTVDVQVQYWDGTSQPWAASFCLQYKRKNSESIASVCHPITGTNCMKTKVFSLTDAFFGNGLPGQSDLRIWSGGQVGTASEDTRRFINVVKVTKW
jgi:hypothetical protein